MCRSLYYLQSDKGNRCDWWLLILISAFRMTQILRHPAPGVDRTPQVGKNWAINWVTASQNALCVSEDSWYNAKNVVIRGKRSSWSKTLDRSLMMMMMMVVIMMTEQRVSAYMSAWESFILKYQRWNWLFCRLDGAKKPWDRANSADRSMVSRWAQPIGYVSVKQKHDSESNEEWFLIFFFWCIVQGTARGRGQWRRLVRPWQNETGKESTENSNHEPKFETEMCVFFESPLCFGLLQQKQSVFFKSGLLPSREGSAVIKEICDV